MTDGGITEHELMRLRSTVNDKLVTFNRQPIVPQPTVLVSKLQLALIELDVLKAMIFGPGSQFEELAMAHAYESLQRFNQWLDEVNAEATRQRLMAPGTIFPPNGNGN